MKHVLFVHSSAELYGSDRSLLNIVSGLDPSRYRPFVVLPCQGPLVEALQKLPNVTVEVFPVAVLRRKNLSIRGGLAFLRDLVASVRFFKSFIREHGIHIVDTNTAVVFPGAIAAKAMGCKSVWHIREIIKSGLENRVISLVMQRYAHVIIANSRATGEALKVAPEKIRVVYNAVQERPDAQLRPHSRPTVGMAGRINRWKGQKLFCDVAALVRRQVPDVEFVIAGEAYAGEAHLKQELQAYIRALGLEDTVTLLGQVEDMPGFYSGLDVFCLPSTQPEPFGLVVIEAMEFGIPVVATDHGGPREIITQGEDGYLVSPQGPEEMAQRVTQLLLDPQSRQAMGSRGREKKRATFSVPAMVRGIEAVFEE